MSRPVRWVGGIVVGVVTVAAVTWMIAAQALRSPAELAAEAEAPDPGPVTVPVEERVLESEVVVRGTVRYDEPIEVELTGQPDVEGRAVITRVPRADDEVTEGDVLLEVSGRPVFALTGELPAYRDLRPGASGDDVAQLQASLGRLGHLDGEPDGELGPATQAAIERLYDEGGHEPAGLSAEDEQRLRAAEERVASARDRVRRAEQAAQGTEQAAPGAPGPATDPGADADGASVAEAEEELDRARAELAEAEAETGTWLPAAEVTYVPELPQRVHEVPVELGDEASGPVATISSPEIVIESSVPTEDVELVREGDEVVVDADNEQLTGRIVALADDPGTQEVAADRHHVLIEPDQPTEELVDASLRVTIPVESTDGQVLAVPLAAVSADPSGDSRVEVLDRPPDGDDSGDTRLVPVEVGLAADGMVEIEPLEGGLSADDLVVVGEDVADGADASDDAAGEG